MNFSKIFRTTFYCRTPPVDYFCYWDNLFLDVCVEAHNYLRKLHKDTEPLKWDEDLAKDASKWADKLLKRDSVAHDKKNEKAGENVFTYFGPRVKGCADAALEW